MVDGSDLYKVAMDELNDAIGVVDGQRATIDGVLAELTTTFSQVEQQWQSPSAATFGTLSREFSTDSAELSRLLSDIVTRMRTTYRNYEDAEHGNQHNLTP